MEEYIKCLQGINQESALVLKNIKLIIEKDDTLSGVCFSYISTFLNFIQNGLPPIPLTKLNFLMIFWKLSKKDFQSRKKL